MVKGVIWGSQTPQRVALKVSTYAEKQNMIGDVNKPHSLKTTLICSTDRQNFILCKVITVPFNTLVS